MRGDAVLVSFDGIDQGLTTKDAKAPTCFELSEDGERFVEASAIINGVRVEVDSDEIKTPKFIRMGWHDTAIPTLQDRNGWPVFAFPAKEIR